MHLLIPDLLLPRAHVHEALAGLALPGLTQLLRHATEVEREPPQPEFQRTMPATRWLLRAFGAPASSEAAPLAPYMLAADGGEPHRHAWFVLLPCHFALARDHVQLGEDVLAITADEARALFDAARPTLAEGDNALVMTTPGRWYYRNDAFGNLLCSEPARAVGRNIDLWLPDVRRGEDDGPARLWRRLHNDVQMLWHEHPVNRAREARSEPTVNALWLYGGGPSAALARKPARPPLPDHVAPHVGQPLLRGLAQRSGMPLAERTPAGSALVLLDELARSACREDWAQWRIALAALERDWFTPLAARGTPVTLTLCSETSWQTRRCAGGARWKFWRRGTLTELLSA